MTDKSTLALNARQWRVLLSDHLDVLKGAVANTENINEEALRNLYKHLDEMKMQATAWFQVSVQPGVVPMAEPINIEANGAVPRRRGRPKKAEAQVVQ